MKTTRNLSRIAKILIVAGVSQVSAKAEGINISTQSPFLPRAGSSITGPTENTQVELRGILKGDAGPVFAFYDIVKKQGGWVKLNEQSKDFPITVRNYDAANEAVAVEYQGRSMNLQLKQAKIDAAPAMAMVSPPRPMVAPGQPPAVANGPSAEDARRLEAVAAEVARRRQARQAAAQQQQQPPQGMPNIPNRQR